MNRKSIVKHFLTCTAEPVLLSEPIGTLIDPAGEHVKERKIWAN